MLTLVDLSSYAPAIAELIPLPFNAALVAASVYVMFYLALSPMLGVVASSLVIGMLLGANWLHDEYGTSMLQTLVIVHVVSWVVQFYGHGVHEGRSPALLDNLLQAFLMAPLFVLIEVLCTLGFMREFRARVQKFVDAELQSWKTKDKKAA